MDFDTLGCDLVLQDKLEELSKIVRWIDWRKQVDWEEREVDKQGGIGNKG